MQDVFSCKNPTEDYSIGQNLLSQSKRLPFVLSGSYTSMGLIESDRITTLEASGQVSITNKHAKLMRNAKIRMDSIHQAMDLMRKYYAK
jgi:hypothetical protein